MTEWSVEFDIVHNLDLGEKLDLQVVDLLDKLQRYSASASHDAVTLSVRLSVDATSAEAAIAKASGALLTGLRRAGFAMPVFQIARVEAETAAELERRLQEADVPELAGVAEVSRMLRVSKQRVSELMKSRSFPRPICELEASPIWRSSSIIRFAQSWERKPGRPRKIAESYAERPGR